MKTATLDRSWDMDGGPATWTSHGGPTGFITRDWPLATSCTRVPVAHPKSGNRSTTMPSSGLTNTCTAYGSSASSPTTEQLHAGVASSTQTLLPYACR